MMFNHKKYEKKYFLPPNLTYDWVKNETLESASDTEFRLLRTLIDHHMIPDDVTIMVITQAREHIIRRTFEAIKGVPKAIVHLYNSTSEAQRRQVFKKTKDEVKQMAMDGAILVKELAEKTESDIYFQYSPESFPGTEYSMPHIFASQIEYIHKNLTYRDSVTLSVHPHNDRGSGVSDAEFGVLAGAERVEGTLFGIGERTGNVDLITLAMNMYSQGYDPKLNFNNLEAIRKQYEKLTNITVHERQPYSGEMVFTAFSGSHQDAISKGMKYRKEHHVDKWDVPYIPVDPVDLGRNYQTDVIRINSQSGKGGIGYLLETN